MQEKISVRRAIKERLEHLSERDRRVESQIICRELKKLIGNTPKTIGVYCPLSDEPDIRPLITELLEEGWKVCMPMMQGITMTFWRIRSLDDVKRDQITGIPQPIHGVAMENEETIENVLVPGRAFSLDCHRLGRGNGGYDRWIARQRERSPKTRYVGICFECQLLQKLPTEPHDAPMDMVLTVRKLLERVQENRNHQH
jgi:5-formyltetrahydrofolate cyclo-ligase